MTIDTSTSAFSVRRSRLNGFDAAYRVAISAREASGVDHFIIRTGDALQPFRVTNQCPRDASRVITHVV
jgi:hypothetical protein